MDYNPRQQRHRGEPKFHSHYLSLPVHRSLCWWPSAMSCQKHFDGQFIFMWNAYGAATFSQSVTKICDADQNKGLTKGEGDVCISRTSNMGDVLLVPWLKKRKMPGAYLKRLKITGLLLAGKKIMPFSIIKILKTIVCVRWIWICMANDLELVQLAFNRVKELSLKYGDSIPHLISIFQRTCPAGSQNHDPYLSSIDPKRSRAVRRRYAVNTANSI